MNLDLWFSTPIWYDNFLFEENDQLIKYCLLRKFYDNGNIKSNFGGWQSKDLHFGEDPILDKFLNHIQKKLDFITDFINEKNGKFMLTNSWININGYGTKNHIHTHSRSDFSGVYYVKAEENQGVIEFETPCFHFINNLLGDFQGYINAFPIQSHYKPITGTILIFPSFLPHSVLTNNTNLDRISIAFNSNFRNFPNR